MKDAVSRAEVPQGEEDTHPELQQPTTMAFFPRHSGFSWQPGCFDECVIKPWNSSVENDGIRGSPEKPVAMMTAGEHAVSPYACRRKDLSQNAYGAGPSSLAAPIPPA